MKILVVGGGGREHALCWKLAASPRLTKLYCAPGNPGIGQVADLVPVSATDVPAIVAFAKQSAIDFVVVGPEEPLTLGLVDALEAAGIAAFGPSQAAAALEGSKGFMKDVVAAAGVPTAAYRRFTDAEAARAYVREQGAPIVVKTDGLAAGKGVTVALTLAEAEAAIAEAMEDGKFGKAGAELVIEEFMEGEEVSFFVLCDGTHAVPLAAAQDHKRAFDGDEGPNTGGMGAYSPAPIFTPALEAEVMATIIQPTLDHMAARETPYKGVLFAGLMITAKGPRLIEYNVRFGDPECQTILPRLTSDLLPALLASRNGHLDDVTLLWGAAPSLTVILAGQGYPGEPKKGGVIQGFDAAGSVPGVTVFHAGTKQTDAGIVGNGGRVLAVTATGTDLIEARTRAYQAVDLIDWADGFCRRDIGWRALGK
ncbi:phosphoribosylamine--glycine ligase [Elstera cyanobacteriorum]|uniref:Phosphoribosylamine--glycine ligase n=1 Tax=Elstera cyanobacteriorum TaxID=2022747 RepID=A0A255XS38_9PROT|nr:phosphoribosylamine--glycine ligase [Elstera cyanobacteriorum]OYQ19806.1 phosphoribosylamine--glycine ligase [Elstera cyanobacteriorum]GFZ95729.1 phosphoribosylamine--glycine ligase [Elstera cyanobacteriorum]